MTRDPLTGLRANPPFKSAVPHRAAIWIDVDHLKALNDRAGHAAGDQAIVEIARAIRGVAGDDCTWRAGGDEFLVTLPVAGEEMRWRSLRGSGPRSRRPGPGSRCRSAWPLRRKRPARMRVR